MEQIKYHNLHNSLTEIENKILNYYQNLPGLLPIMDYDEFQLIYLLNSNEKVNENIELKNLLKEEKMLLEQLKKYTTLYNFLIEDCKSIIVNFENGTDKAYHLTKGEQGFESPYQNYLIAKRFYNHKYENEFSSMAMARFIGILKECSLKENSSLGIDQINCLLYMNPALNFSKLTKEKKYFFYALNGNDINGYYDDDMYLNTKRYREYEREALFITKNIFNFIFNNLNNQHNFGILNSKEQQVIELYIKTLELYAPKFFIEPYSEKNILFDDLLKKTQHSFKKRINKQS